MHPVFYAIGNSYCIKSTNAQLAEMNFALQAPLARREFASKLFFIYAGGESRKRDSLFLGFTKEQTHIVLYCVDACKLKIINQHLCYIWT